MYKMLIVKTKENLTLWTPGQKIYLYKIRTVRTFRIHLQKLIQTESYSLPFRTSWALILRTQNDLCFPTHRK